MIAVCRNCGGKVEEGVASALGLIGGRIDKPDLIFKVPGAPISANPVKAFTQGLIDESADQTLAIRAFRCTQCGLLEFYAAPEAPSLSALRHR